MYMVKKDWNGNKTYKYIPEKKNIKKRKKYNGTNKNNQYNRLYKKIIDYKQTILHSKFDVAQPKNNNKIKDNKSVLTNNCIKINDVEIDIDKLILEYNTLINIPNINLYISNPSYNKKTESKFDKIYSFIKIDNEINKDENREKVMKKVNNDKIKRNPSTYNYIELVSILKEIWRDKINNKTKELFLQFEEEFNFDNKFKRNFH